MTKKDMIKELATKFEITQVEAKRIYDATFDELSDILAHGDSVNVPGFGTFGVTHCKKRKGYNPQIQKFMMLPQKLKTKFKSSELLKNKVNKIDVSSEEVKKENPVDASAADTVVDVSVATVKNVVNLEKSEQNPSITVEGEKTQREDLSSPSEQLTQREDFSKTSDTQADTQREEIPAVQEIQREEFPTATQWFPQREDSLAGDESQSPTQREGIVAEQSTQREEISSTSANSDENAISDEGVVTEEETKSLMGVSDE